jgi:mono/diheme cytochrome c family protein
MSSAKKKSREELIAGDDYNPWCPTAYDLFGKLGDMHLKYEMDWPESAVKEYAALEAGLKEHTQNCAQCCIAEAEMKLRGPVPTC